MSTHNTTQSLRGPTRVGPKVEITYKAIAGARPVWSMFTTSSLVKGDFKKATNYYWRHETWRHSSLRVSYLRGKEVVETKDYFSYAFTAPTPSSALRQQAYNKAYFRLQSELLDGQMGWGISAIQHKLLQQSIKHRYKQAKEYLRLLKRDPSDQKIIDFLIKNRLIDKSGIARAQVQGRTKHVGYFATAGSGGWLEVSYGYLPILSDLYKLMNDVASAQASALRTKRKYKGTARSHNSFIDPQGYRVTTVETAAAVIDVSVWTNEDSALYRANTAGLLNLPVIIADAVPYSFIVNWFTNHEAYLHAITAQTGRQMQGYIGEYREAKRSTEHSGKQSGMYSHYHGSSLHVSKAYDRMAVNGRIRGPSLEGWSFNDTPFRSLMRQLNAAALLIQKGAAWGQRRDEAFRDHRNKLHEARRNIGVSIEAGRYTRVIPGFLTMAEGQRYLDKIRDINNATIRVVKRK